MSTVDVPGGVVHVLPDVLREALAGNAIALERWHDITPLARNELICCVEDAKQAATRTQRIRRTQEELALQAPRAHRPLISSLAP